jgi:hypothetical protein
MGKANMDIRAEAMRKDIRLWQVADAYGMNDGNFSRLLRKELPDEKKQKILEIIDRLYTEKGAKQ